MNVETVIRAVFAYITANLDDLIVFTFLFAYLEEISNSRQNASDNKKLLIYTGYVLLIYSIIFAIPAAVGCILMMFLPYKYLSLLGILTICLGFYEFYQLIRYSCKTIFKSQNSSTNEGNATTFNRNSDNLVSPIHDQRSLGRVVISPEHSLAKDDFLANLRYHSTRNIILSGLQQAHYSTESSSHDPRTLMSHTNNIIGDSAMNSDHDSGVLQRMDTIELNSQEGSGNHSQSNRQALSITSRTLSRTHTRLSALSTNNTNQSSEPSFITLYTLGKALFKLHKYNILAVYLPIFATVDIPEDILVTFIVFLTLFIFEYLLSYCIVYSRQRENMEIVLVCYIKYLVPWLALIVLGIYILMDSALNDFI